MKIYIAGASGQLGSFLKNKLKNKKNIIIFTKRYNLLNIKSYKYLKKIKPDVIINCSGLTDVNLCEFNYIKALKLNQTIPDNLNNFCVSEKIFLIHISTDHIYDGKKNNKSKENQIKIRNNYAKSKLKGEAKINSKKFLILRTNFFGHYKIKKGLLNWIQNSYRKNKKIKIFKNIYFSPLHISSLVNILIKLCYKKIPGIYNLGSRGGISKASFVKKIIKFKKIKLNYEEINYQNHNNSIKRPKNMIMSVSKFEKKFKIRLPTINNEIFKIDEKF